MFRSAAGTMLKFAAIGVISVPLDPAVSVIIPAIAGFTWNGSIRSGTSTPAAITGKAANEFPVTIVNSDMVKQFAKTRRNRLSGGMTLVIPPAIRSPIFADLKTTPSDASN